MDKKKIDIKEIGLPKLMILLVAGVLLVLFSFSDFFKPATKKTSTNSQPTADAQQTSNMSSNDSYASQLEQRLEHVLQEAYGVGKVDVMITLATTGKKITLKDAPTDSENTTQTDTQGGKSEITTEKSEEKTVLVEGKDGSTTPYVLQEVNPQIEGVLVVTEGGDNIKIKEQIINVAQVLFGVPVHKIEVMKMQNNP